jgi:hypothetical protein
MKKIVLYLFLLGCATPLLADTVYMDNGEIIEGTLVSRSEEMITIQTQNGREEINKRFVKRITSSALKPSTTAQEQENQIKESPITNPVPEAQPIQTKQYNEDQYWIDDNSQKQVTNISVKKISKTMIENILKLSVDFAGKHHVASSISVGNVSDTGSATEDTTQALTLTGETVGYLDDNVGLGLGISYQIPRKMTNYEGQFNFMPFYGLLKIRSKPVTGRTYFYGVGQLGYNLFYGDESYKGASATLSGGLYYGLGIGWIIENLNIEFLYSVNHGSLKDSGYLYYNGSYYYTTLKSDIDYSQINMKVGVNF